MIRSGFILLLTVLSLSGCTTPVVQAEVTRFHTPPPPAGGKSFTIVPEQNQIGSLEFDTYASHVANALQSQGWRAVPPGQGAAQNKIALRWGTGQPNTVTWQSPSMYGGFGYGSGGWGGRSWSGIGVGIPFGDPFPSWETRSMTTYPKWVEVDISEGGRRVFEGRAIADDSRREIARVMPSLIRALFTGFPGESGTTVKVTVPLGEEGVKGP